MTTESKKVKLYLRSGMGILSGRDAEFELSFKEQKSCEYFIYKYVCDIDIKIPALSKGEISMMMLGAELEAVEAERARYKAETIDKLAMLDARIEELRCIEFKAGE